MNPLYPFKSNYLDLGGLKYHYIDEGNGPPVIMLHGNPTWSFYYRNLARELKEQYRVIVPDHIGCGLSDKPGDDDYEFTLQRRVEDLEKLVDHLGLGDDITLIVHDWGGMIGMVYASRHRGKIKRLVVMNTSGFHLPKGKMFPWQLWLTRTPIGGFMVQGLNAFCLAAASLCMTRSKMPGEVREQYLAPYNSWDNRLAVLRFVQDIPLQPGDSGFDLVSSVEAALPEFKSIPLLLIWGEKDFVFDTDFLDGWIKRFPDAQVRRFADAGHYILEDAADEVIPIIKEFLEKNPVR